MKKLRKSFLFPQRLSLRLKIAVGVALPILVVLSVLSYTHYLREKNALEEQVELGTLQLGDMMLGSLRHAMLINDFEMIQKITSNVGEMENISQVQIVDFDRQVIASSHDLDTEGSPIRDLSQSGCSECHQFPSETRPRLARLPTSDATLRIATPIRNDTECQACHTQERANLGVVLIDVSLVDFEAHALSDLRLDLAISAIGTGLVALLLYLLLQWLVIRRVEAFRVPLSRFQAGDLTPRMPMPSTTSDELCDLAEAFNQMADNLDQQIREKEALHQTRQRAITEERKRIARDLHDGLGQLLGYINTKVMAARLMLNKDNIQGATTNLLDLEEATRGLFAEIRDAILGLKVAAQIGDGIDQSLRAFIHQHRRSSHLPIELDIDPEVENLGIDGECELQIIRIAQEALTNIRKHALASQVRVSLRVDADQLEMVIGDDGKGFTPGGLSPTNQLHFGISTMKERAAAIGGTLAIDSERGVGTQVRLRLPLPMEKV